MITFNRGISTGNIQGIMLRNRKVSFYAIRYKTYDSMIQDKPVKYDEGSLSNIMAFDHGTGEIDKVTTLGGLTLGGMTDGEANLIIRVVTENAQTWVKALRFYPDTDRLLYALIVQSKAIIDGLR